MALGLELDIYRWHMQLQTTMEGIQKKEDELKGVSTSVRSKSVNASDRP